MSIPPQIPRPSTPSGGRPAAPISKLVDELGDLDVAIQAGRKAEELARPLKKELAAAMNLAPGESCIADGSKYQCFISEQQNQREITDMAELFEMLGREKFLAHCSFPLAKIDELLGDCSPVLIPVKAERTGPRKFKFIRVLMKKALKKAA